MKVCFISNYLNHHQKPFCDEMYKRLGAGFRFIATETVPEWRKELGYTEMTADYLYKIDENLSDYINQCDFVIIGSAPYALFKQRIKDGKLTFYYSERLFKNGIPWARYPSYLINNYLHMGRYDNVYMLSASAYTAYDYSKTFTFLGKCYKWGYFPEVRKYNRLSEIFDRKKNNNEKKKIDVSILWAARLIDLKHPESLIFLAKKLKEDNVRFELNIIGIGPLKDEIQRSIEDNGLSDCVHMLGAMSPDQVRKYMELSDVFLFTSDKNEGWGAVLNEAMNSVCTVIASDAIGSVPFLLKNDNNGLIFRNGDWNHLLTCVKRVIDNPAFCHDLSRNAYNTIVTNWNAEKAVENLLLLVNALRQGKETPIEEGPCSIAPIIKS